MGASHHTTSSDRLCDKTHSEHASISAIVGVEIALRRERVDARFVVLLNALSKYRASVCVGKVVTGDGGGGAGLDGRGG